MNSESVIIEKIVEANENDKLAIFVGAGISKSSAMDKMPSWDTLIDKIKRRINEKDETDYLKIAQYFYNTVGEIEYYKTIEEMFPVSISPSNVHKQIFDINPHIIITTNWDSILECANKMYTRSYDIVCNDRDLVESVFYNKIIKMHGDFSHKNIVFKEEDYLDYEKYFPLILNYIKSILSTHIVLFLGYSYKDINLKFIIQWLRNNAVIRPDMFLAEFKDKPHQIEYLRKQGIETIILKDIDKKLNGITDLDQYSKMTYTFLNKIYKGYDPRALKKDDNNIVIFIYKKLKPLDSLNGILLDQIQDLLTNCGFVYDSDCSAILEFSNDILTGDYNREIRDIYLKFAKILNYSINDKKNHSNELLKLLSIFVKAGIKGIMLNNAFISFNNIFNQKNNILLSCNFDFEFNNYIIDVDDVDILFESAYKLYNLKKIKEAYNVTEKIIDITASSNNHVKLFIALFNRNILLGYMKSETFKRHDIESRYNNLTSQLKMAVAPVFEFLNFSDVNKFLNISINDLDNIRKNKQTIDSGGFVYSSDINKFSGKHINLMNFVLSNRIMIENSSEFKKINNIFIEIAILRQTQNKKTMLIRPEIYSCIKYINIDDLTNLFFEYHTEGSDKFGTFDMSSDDKNWLINTVLNNCVNQYIIDDFIFSSFSLYINNILFILSLTPLSDIDNKYIFSLINKLISEKNNDINLGFFRSLNLFLWFQHKIYKPEIDKQLYINLLETFINKTIDKKVKGYEFIALSENYLSNLFYYASISGVIFESAEMVNNLLTSMSEFNADDKLSMIQNFIFNIYQISNDNIKSIVKDYALSFKVEREIPLYKRISFNNALIILKFKEFTNENLNEIQTFIEPYTKNNSFITILYGMDKQIDYMATKLNINELQETSLKIKEIIKNNEKRERRSIF